MEVRGGKGTHTSALRPFPPFWASWSVLVATAGFASKFWSGRSPREVRGVAVSVSFDFPRRWLRDGRDRLAECAEALEVQQPLRRPAGRQLFWPLDCMLIRVHHVRCLRPSRSVLLRGLFHGFAGGVDVQERLKARSSEQRRAR
eukprot:7911548-Pyramimonas_sp.AAC.1